MLGLQDLFASPFLVLCSVAAALGGFLFGFDQGLIRSVTHPQRRT